MTIASLSKVLETLDFCRSIGDHTFEDCLKRIAEWEERTRRADYRPDLTYAQKVESCQMRFDGDPVYAPHDYYFQFCRMGPDLQFTVPGLNGGIILHKCKCETKADMDKARCQGYAVYNGESYHWETHT